MASDRFDKGSGMTPFERPGSDIRKMGLLRKLKTNKKKFFVLRSTSSSGPARLEYYDSEKKFRNGQLPKRSIQLHTLLNINKKMDSKHKYAIALYTKDDCFSVMADDELEQDNWYALLLMFQCEYLREGENQREHFEHVWQVTIQQKGLGTDKLLRGSFRLCLSRLSISLFRVNSEKPQISFQLTTVRSLAHNDNLFRMEVGSWAPTGAGELWMQVEDAVIAKSMHECILNCMKANVSGFDDSENQRFDKRAESIHSGAYRVRPISEEFRSRTVSESHMQSPRRIRAKQGEDQPRPMSTAFPISRSTAEWTQVSTSPLGYNESLHGAHRFRSDSQSSRSSHTSYHAPSDDLSPMEFPLTAQLYSGPPSETSHNVISEEDDTYSEHDFIHDFTPVSSSPGDRKTPLDEDAGGINAYMEMRPGTATPPTTGNTGYIPMTLGATSSSHELTSPTSSDSSSYMSMAPGRKVSEPIPIKQANPPVGGGYMDMSHSSHLPTVREGGSNEGYLPMTPNSGQSPIVSSHLRPDPTVCMLSDDSIEFHKRTYSLGSRPPTKSSARTPSIHDPVPIKRGLVDNEGRSCSAPHLITHRVRGLNIDSPTPSASPLSMSFKSESSYRSDDSDSFMELDFHRPRTASDSYGSRPRAEIQALQSHRPRSSSYTLQNVRAFKLKQGMKLGSYESVRTTSHELLHRTSIDSLSHRSSKDSLRVSSNESLRKLSEEVRAKTNLLNTDYMDMSLDKRKTPSPQPPRGRENGYMDMTLGVRTTSPSRTKSSQDSGTTSKSQSSEKLHVHGHSDDDYANMESFDSGPTYKNIDLPTQSLHSQYSGATQSHRGADSVGGNSYVMYEPSTKSATCPTEDTHTAGKQGSTSSLKKKSRDKSKGKDHRHKSGSHSKRKSQGDHSKDIHVTKITQPGKLQQVPAASGEYIEFAPGSASTSTPEKPRHETMHSESEYIGFEPGVVSSAAPVSKPQAVKSYFSKSKTDKESAKSASGDSRVKGSVGSVSHSKSASKNENSDYVLSSPAGKSVVSPVKEESDYVLSSPAVVKPQVDSKESDYVLSSPKTCITSAASKDKLVPKDKSPSIACQASSTSVSAGGQVKQTADSKSEKLKDRSGSSSESSACSSDLAKKQNEGSSVDPVVPKLTSRQLSDNASSPLKNSSSDSKSTGNPKTLSSADKEEAPPCVVKKDKQYGRTKHYSGSAGSPSAAKSKGESQAKGQGQSDISTSALTRPESTPCMLSLGDKDLKPVPAKAMLTVDQNPRSRHSISDLSGYEQMNFPSNTLSSGQQSSSNTLTSSQQQVAPSSPKVLNYASLDLGSSETFSDGDSCLRSPRTKSRHSSAADDKGEPPLTYSQIDFEKSESLKASGANKDVTFTL